MYNALQVKLNRRFSSGLLLTGACTWGKGMSYQRSDDGGLDFYVNLQPNYARTDFERKQTFVSRFVYDLPFGSGKWWLGSGLSSKILGGWQMNGILTIMSGLPLTLTTSAAGLNLPGATQTVNEVAPVVRPKGIGSGSFWFNPASFASPAPLTFGNTGINIFDGPGFFDLDFSLFKNVALSERFRLQLRAEHSTRRTRRNTEIRGPVSQAVPSEGYRLLWGQLRTARPSARSKAFVLSDIFGSQ
jgi:hypothetical protein